MQDKIKRYSRILQKNRKADFFTPCERMLADCRFGGEDKVLFDTTACVTGPVLVDYVLWILRDAVKNGIRRLYFLARDGYILREIAQTVCRAYRLDVDCRYFYCSRYSLRRVLFLIDREEALDKSCINGFHITPEIVLERAGLNDQEREQILSLLGIRKNGPILSETGLNKLRDRLASCEPFLNLACRKSEAAYSQVRDYFRQEGMFESVSFAIVDTGWMGSMQRSIRQILEYSGCGAWIHGYYFGMFERGNPEDGTFSCYYFSKDRHFFQCVNFNNNLFECLCTADHGMTVGYQKQADGRIEPVLKPFRKTWNLDLQLQAVKSYAENFVEVNSTLPVTGSDSHKMSYGLLRSFMAYPSREEAGLYGSIPFCDDLTEKYMLCLSERLSVNDLKQQMTLQKIFRKLFCRASEKDFRESFWIQGTLSRFDYRHKAMLRFDLQISEWIKYIRRYFRRPQ